MENQELISKILEKKFKKTVFAGYDAEDVDNFFDQIIDSIHTMSQYIETYRQEIENMKIIQSKLQTKNDELMQQLSQKNTIIKQFESEGYANVHTNRRLSNLEKMINNGK